MAEKTVAKMNAGEDILGLVAFGSLITNIFQLASKKSLEEQHEALKAYVTELKTHYHNMKTRERQIYSKNLEMKRANEELIALNDKLLRELRASKEEIIKLISLKSEASIGRRRYIPTKIGESK